MVNISQLIHRLRQHMRILSHDLAVGYRSHNPYNTPPSAPMRGLNSFVAAVGSVVAHCAHHKCATASREQGRVEPPGWRSEEHHPIPAIGTVASQWPNRSNLKRDKQSNRSRKALNGTSERKYTCDIYGGPRRMRVTDGQ